MHIAKLLPLLAFLALPAGAAPAPPPPSATPDPPPPPGPPAPPPPAPTPGACIDASVDVELKRADERRQIIDIELDLNNDPIDISLRRDNDARGLLDGLLGGLPIVGGLPGNVPIVGGLSGKLPVPGGTDVGSLIGANVNAVLGLRRDHPAPRQLAQALQALEGAVDALADAVVGAVPAIDGGAPLPPLRRQLEPAVNDLLQDLKLALGALLGPGPEANPLAGGGTPPNRRQLVDADVNVDLGLRDHEADGGAEARGLLDGIPIVGGLLGGLPIAGGSLSGLPVVSRVSGNLPVSGDLIGANIATGLGLRRDGAAPARRQLAGALQALQGAVDQVAKAIVGRGEDGGPLRRQLEPAVTDLLHQLELALDALLGPEPQANPPAGEVTPPHARQLVNADVNVVLDLRDDEAGAAPEARGLPDLVSGVPIVGGNLPVAGSGPVGQIPVLGSLLNGLLGNLPANGPLVDASVNAMAGLRRDDGAPARRQFQPAIDDLINELELALDALLGSGPANPTTAGATPAHRRQLADADINAVLANDPIDISLRGHDTGAAAETHAPRAGIPILGDLLGNLPIVGPLLGNLPANGPLVDANVDVMAGLRREDTHPVRRQLEPAIDDLLHQLELALDALLGPAPGPAPSNPPAGAATPHRRQFGDIADLEDPGAPFTVDVGPGVEVVRRQLGGCSASPGSLIGVDASGALCGPLGAVIGDVNAHLADVYAHIGVRDDAPTRRQLAEALQALEGGIDLPAQALIGTPSGAPLRRQLGTAAVTDLLNNLKIALDAIGDQAPPFRGDGSIPPHRRQVETLLDDILGRLQPLLDDLLGSPAPPAGGTANPHRRQVEQALDDLLKSLGQTVDALIVGERGMAPPGVATDSPHRRQLSVVLDDALKGLGLAIDDLDAGANGGTTNPPHRRQVDEALDDVLHGVQQADAELLGSQIEDPAPARRQLDVAVNDLTFAIPEVVDDALVGPEEGVPLASLPPPVGGRANIPRRRQLAAAAAEDRRQTIPLPPAGSIFTPIDTTVNANIEEAALINAAIAVDRRGLIDVDVDADVDVALRRRQLGRPPLSGLGELPGGTGNLRKDKVPIGEIPVDKPPVHGQPSFPSVPPVPGKLPLGPPPLPFNLPLLSDLGLPGQLLGPLRREASPQHGDDDLVDVDALVPVAVVLRRDNPPNPPIAPSLPDIQADLTAKVGSIVADLGADTAGMNPTPPTFGYRRRTARQLVDVDLTAPLYIGDVPPPAPPANRRQLVGIDVNIDLGATCNTPEFTAQLAALSSTLNSNGAGNFGTLVLTALAQTQQGCAFVFPLVNEGKTILAPQDSACTPEVVSQFTADPSLLLIYFSPNREVHSTDFIRADPIFAPTFAVASAELVSYWRGGMNSLWLELLGSNIEAVVLRADIPTATGTAMILKNAWGQPATLT